MTEILKGRHILIAEDNPTNRLVVSKMIEQLGGTYDLAEDGVEAIRLFQPKKFDLALLDIEMPRLSGLEVIQHIRERSDTPADFPIVALTAFVLSEHRTKIRKTGADAIIAKPIIDIVKFGKELATHIRVDVADTASPITKLEETIGRAGMPEFLASLSSDFTTARDRLTGSALDDIETELPRIAHSLVPLATMLGENDLQNLSGKIELSKGDSSAPWTEWQNELIEQLTLVIAQVQTMQNHQHAN